jgi:hypothetical protein
MEVSLLYCAFELIFGVAQLRVECYPTEGYTYRTSKPDNVHDIGICYSMLRFGFSSDLFWAYIEICFQEELNAALDKTNA